MLFDSYQRRIRDLRISLTDRCNFRCFYCRSASDGVSTPDESILSFEEIVRLSEIFVGLGIEKIRLTGGEPLLRKNIEKLIAELAKLKNPAANTSDPQSASSSPKLKDLAMTTNGFGLERRAGALRKAGLDRVTVSLDSLEAENFRWITGVDRLQKVLAGIKAAQDAGLSPVKINSVIIRGRNDTEICALAEFVRQTGVSLRFIEFMPLDSGRVWRSDRIVPGREIFQIINSKYPLTLTEQSRGRGTAWNYVFRDGAAGEIGIIAPVTESFCGQCSRIRLTADGQLRTCLFSTREHDLQSLLRGGAGRREIVRFIRSTIMTKEPRHLIEQTGFRFPSRTMSSIGG